MSHRREADSSGDGTITVNVDGVEIRVPKNDVGPDFAYVPESVITGDPRDRMIRVVALKGPSIGEKRR